MRAVWRAAAPATGGSRAAVAARGVAARGGAAPTFQLLLVEAVG